MSGENDKNGIRVTEGLELQEYTIPTGSTGGGYDPYNSADSHTSGNLRVPARLGNHGRKWSALDSSHFERKSCWLAAHYRIEKEND